MKELSISYSKRKKPRKENYSCAFVQGVKWPWHNADWLFFLREIELDYQTLWERFKLKMKELSVSYSKRKKHRKEKYSCAFVQGVKWPRHSAWWGPTMYRESEKAWAGQTKTQLLEQHKARAAQVRKCKILHVMTVFDQVWLFLFQRRH